MISNFNCPKCKRELDEDHRIKLKEKLIKFHSKDTNSYYEIWQYQYECKFCKAEILMQLRIDVEV